MIFTRDFVTREYYWLTASHVTKNDIHGNSYIILHFCQNGSSLIYIQGMFTFCNSPIATDL